MKSHLTRSPSNGNLPPSEKRPKDGERKILHVDMNSFFASVEQQCNPELRGKPIFVCGEGRTVVTTASYEARAYGVKTGMSKYEALRKCPSAIPVIGDHRKYADTSARIWEILKGYTDKAEMFSIDEAFLDVTDCLRHFKDEIELAKDIKKKIKDTLGLTCSVGIAPNKLLAKLGSDMQKPDGLVVINKENVADVLKDLPVEDFCGIGEKTRRKLAALGIRNAKQLGDAEEGFLCNHFGFMGHFLKNMGRGIDNSEVGFYYDEEAAKSVGHSYTLPENTLDDEVLRSYLLWLSEKVGRRMRQAGYSGRVVHFVIRYGDFTGEGRQKALKAPIDRGSDIYKTALDIMNSFKPFPKPVRLLGVSVAGLTEDENQLCLFEEDKKKISHQKAIDGIKDIYGENSIVPVSIMKRRAKRHPGR